MTGCGVKAAYKINLVNYKLPLVVYFIHIRILSKLTFLVTQNLSCRKPPPTTLINRGC